MANKLTGGGTVFGTNENSMAAAIERQLNEHLAANPTALKIVMTSAPHDEDDYVGHVVIEGTDI